ncbi:MAG: UvrD-helicase domain-containing protein [Deltaproteobacteria bacterium]|nr:UvrD-helicase domain-containing protein [Deltaproteobacteria bacterium]
MRLARDVDALVERFGLTAEQARAVARRGHLVVVAAGAGTGKTTTMASRYVDTALALAEDALDARPHAPLQPRTILERLAAVTFTELAAGELRARIAAVFLRVSERLGEHPRLAAFAVEAARLEGDLAIGTLHSLCARLLRRMAFTGAVPPDFSVLDELERGLAWEAALDDALDAAAASDPGSVERLLTGRRQVGPLRETVRRLCRELSEAALVRLAERSLAELGAEAARRAVELLHAAARAPDVRDAVEEAARARVALAAGGGKAFDTALDTALRWVRGEGSALLASEGLRAFGATEARLAKLGPEDGERLVRFSAAVAHLSALAAPLAKGLDAEVLASEHGWTRDVARLASDAARRFAAAKQAAGALDFDDLESAALDALGTAAPLGGGPVFDEVLVDEFQDTSARQVQILRGVAGSALERVFAVGDAKQSIYRFRGADVAVFNAVGEAVPGGVSALTVNRRSTAGVLAFVNAVFERLLPPRTSPEAPWEAPMQRLVPLRQDAPDAPLPPVVLVPWAATDEAGEPLNAADLRRADAAVCAAAVARVMELLGSERQELGVLLRAVRGERRAYADAIAARDIPVAVEAGGTFTTDAATACGLALLRALALPGHEAAWAAVLRGPLIGMPAERVAALRSAARTSLQQACLTEAALAPLSEPAAAALQTLVAESTSTRPLSRRARRVVEASGVASRQIDKLLDITADLEARGLGPARTLAWFEALTAADRDRRVPDPPGPGVVVRALTVHASKGLEFPVVVVPQLAEPFVSPRSAPEVIQVGGEPVVGLRIPDLPGRADTVARTFIKTLERARERAEQLRLLYVALTRAEDHLVLSLPLGAGEGADDATRALLPLLASVDLGRAGPATLELPGGAAIPIAVWPTDPGPLNTPAPPPAPLDLEPVPPGRGSLGPPTWSVTRLASLAFCPAYHAQAPVAPWPRPLRPELYPDPPPQPPLEAATGPSSSSARGTAIHRWFEAVAHAPAGVDVPLPPALQAEGEPLRARLAALLAHPDLADAFAPGARALVELPLEGERHGVVLTGSIDRVSLHPLADGRLQATIVDFKTGLTGYPGPGGRHAAYIAAYRFQIAAYAWLLGEALGPRLLPQVRGRLAFVDPGDVLVLDYELDTAALEVDRVLSELHAPGSLPPNHAACDSCRMQPFCPVARGRST